jgi:toxin ParE1/3/4
MVKVIWTKTALNNLDDIGDYIALDKPTAAYKLIDKITTKVDSLEEHPEMGRKPPEFKTTKFKELLIPPCRVFYYFEDNNIYVVHIMRSEQQLRRYMLEDNSVHEKRRSIIYDL